MKKNVSLVVTLSLLCSIFAPNVCAQQPTPGRSLGVDPRPAVPSFPQPQPGNSSRQPQRPAGAPTPTPDAGVDDDEVARITTNLVQVDAVVVDKKGRQVTDLKAEDFEIYEDKRAQSITNFSYVLNEAIAPAPQSDRPPAEGGSSEQELLDSPAVRRFRARSGLVLAYVVYNARLDRATNRPQLSAQTRIYRDGQLVYQGAGEPLQLTDYPDVKRIDVAAQLQLGSNLTPGEYVIQIVVTDLLAKESDPRRIATQWVDFEIVK